MRRIRRILDVSQRGLAAILDVSQSVVARWETGRTSPRASVIVELLGLAKLHVTIHDDETGEKVEPMRDDGGRDRGGRRYPGARRSDGAGLVVSPWRGVDDAIFRWQDRSRARRSPRVRFRTSPGVRLIERMTWGTPVDHPSDRQLVAEAQHQDEVREERREQIWAAKPWLRPRWPGRPLIA